MGMVVLLSDEGSGYTPSFITCYVYLCCVYTYLSVNFDGNGATHLIKILFVCGDIHCQLHASSIASFLNETRKIIEFAIYALG